MDNQGQCTPSHNPKGPVPQRSSNPNSGPPPVQNADRKSIKVRFSRSPDGHKEVFKAPNGHDTRAVTVWLDGLTHCGSFYDWVSNVTQVCNFTLTVRFPSKTAFEAYLYWIHNACFPVELQAEDADIRYLIKCIILGHKMKDEEFQRDAVSFLVRGGVIHSGTPFEIWEERVYASDSMATDWVLEGYAPEGLRASRLVKQAIYLLVTDGDAFSMLHHRELFSHSLTQSLAEHFRNRLPMNLILEYFPTDPTAPPPPYHRSSPGNSSNSSGQSGSSPSASPTPSPNTAPPPRYSLPPRYSQVIGTGNEHVPAVPVVQDEGNSSPSQPAAVTRDGPALDIPSSTHQPEAQDGDEDADNDTGPMQTTQPGTPEPDSYSPVDRPSHEDTSNANNLSSNNNAQSNDFRDLSQHDPSADPGSRRGC
ncbi:hypothetical protein M011DRAFT_5862 [Sporormia fimetaria CBS 119925]|uniref:Uncharacterized protein n=1 Tax=Sporormia fimetaria CBS 119925 TaxID=1340428 RepID=A0A6A6VMG4_9PLEO|nr:hypothetical protein M011DRAFT_5862 [Sporormia fimetaria CBS 119925]